VKKMQNRLKHPSFWVSFGALFLDLLFILFVIVALDSLARNLLGIHVKRIIAFVVYFAYFVVLAYKLQSTLFMYLFGYKYVTNRLKKPSKAKFAIRASLILVFISAWGFLVAISFYLSLFIAGFTNISCVVVVTISIIFLSIVPLYVTAKINKRDIIFCDYMARLVPIKNNDTNNIKTEKKRFSTKGIYIAVIFFVVFFVVLLGIDYYKEFKNLARNSKIHNHSIHNEVQITKAEKEKAKKIMHTIDYKLKSNKNNINTLVYYNLYKDLEKILQKNSIAKYEDQDVFSPLQKAFIYKSNEALKILLKNGANIYNSNNAAWTIAPYMSKDKDALELFLDYGFDINYSYLNEGYTFLHYIAYNKCKKIDIAEFLLANGANTEIKNRYNKRAIDIAKVNCNNKDYSKFKELIAKYKNIDKNKTYKKLFRVDAKLPKIEDSNLTKLISKIKEQSKLFVEANSSMQIYEHYFKIELLTYYIAKRLKELDTKNPYKEANIIKLYNLNSYANNIELVKKAKFNLARASEFARMKNISNAKMAAYRTINKGADLNNSFATMLDKLIYTHKSNIAYKKLEKFHSEALDKNNTNNALFIEFYLNMLDDWYIDMRYLQQQAKIEKITSKIPRSLSHIYKSRQKDKEHPVFAAIELYDNKRFLQEIKKIKNIEITNRHNQTMLCIAELYNNKLAIDMLLKRGAKINILVGATKKYSLLSWLMLGGGFTNTDNTKELIQKGANVNLRGKNGKTAISIIAQSCKNFRISKLLMESGANPYIRDLRGLNAFDKVKKCKNKRQRDRMLKILNKGKK